MAAGTRLTKDDLGLEIGDEKPMTLKEARDIVEKEMITRSLARHNLNLTRVASELGISRPTLYEFMDRLGVKRDGLS